MTAGSGTERLQSLDNETIARWLAEELKHAIEEGRYARNSRLPSERTLSREYGVPLRAVRDSLDLLDKEGIVYRLERTGTFVRGPAPRSDETGSRLRAVTFVEDFWPVPRDRQFALSDYLAAYTDVLDGTHVQMRFRPCPEGSNRFDQLLSDSLPLKEQGCVLVNVAPPDLMNWLGERGIPFVVQYYRGYEQEGLPPHHSVSVNKFRGIFEGVQHLLSLGHRRIGFMGVPDDPVTGGAYNAAMRWGGVVPRPGYMLKIDTDNAEVAYPIALEFLKNNRDLTAVFAQADALAIGLLRAARALGIRVPEELSIVGFNDQPEAAEADPPLTTVATPRKLLARTALQMLLNLAKGECPTWEHRVLECRLVVRKSTAPPLARRPNGDGKGGVAQ